MESSTGKIKFNFFDKPFAITGARNSKEAETNRKFMELAISDPSFSIVICCPDDTTDVKKLIGLSIVRFKKSSPSIELAASESPSAVSFDI